MLKIHIEIMTTHATKKSLQLFEVTGFFKVHDAS